MFTKIEQCRFLSDDELERWAYSQPGNLIIEGEIVRRARERYFDDVGAATMLEQAEASLEQEKGRASEMETALREVAEIVAGFAE